MGIRQTERDDMKQNKTHPEWVSDRESWFNIIKKRQPYTGNDGKVRNYDTVLVESSE